MHLVLPHLLADPDYNRHYQRVEGYKILDNGIAENVKTRMPDLVRLAHRIRADEIVVPDVMGDCNKTIDLAYRFEPHAAKGMNYMGVMQGKTMAEAAKCLTAFQLLPYINVIGVPRCLAAYIHRGIRATIAQSMKETGIRHPIHMLGSTREPREVVTFSSLDNVRSMDTCMPISLAYRKQNIRHGEYKERQKGYFALPIPDLSVRQLMEDNIRTFLDWANAEPIC